MSTGTVKWFNDGKGFGFIVPDAKGAEELFVHFSNIQMQGRQTLRENQRVSFAIERGQRGMEAMSVMPLPDVTAPAEQHVPQPPTLKKIEAKKQGLLDDLLENPKGASVPSIRRERHKETDIEYLYRVWAGLPQGVRAGIVEIAKAVEWDRRP